MTTITAIYNKLIALLLSFFTMLGLPVGSFGNGEVDNVTADMTIVFDDENPGTCAGNVSVEANADGNYDIYWGDENGEKLTAEINGKTISYSEFVTVSVCAGKGEWTFNDFLTIPENAETMLLYKGDTLLETEQLPEYKLPVYGDEMYSFGALSDVHFNRYTDDDGNDTTEKALPQALDFLDECGVQFVGISGDLSNNGEKESYESFNRIVSDYDFPVYSCKGNHDCRAKYTLENWQNNINKDVYSDNRPANVLDVADNGLDFVYELNGDIFIFFSQISNTYYLGKQLVTDAQLDWLETQLKKYSDRTVYFFFHTFLGNDSLPTNMCEGNIINNVGAHYTLTYVKGNKDEKRLKSLLSTYKNVIFFNGHSHWSYNMQKYNINLNISDYDGKYCTMVHVGSVGAPRTITDYSVVEKSNPGTMSEGLLITVYNDRVLIRAVDFVSGTFLAYATYSVDTIA